MLYPLGACRPASRICLRSSARNRRLRQNWESLVSPELPDATSSLSLSSISFYLLSLIGWQPSRPSTVPLLAPVTCQNDSQDNTTRSNTHQKIRRNATVLVNLTHRLLRRKRDSVPEPPRQSTLHGTASASPDTQPATRPSHQSYALSAATGSPIWSTFRCAVISILSFASESSTPSAVK